MSARAVAAARLTGALAATVTALRFLHLAEAPASSSDGSHLVIAAVRVGGICAGWYILGSAAFAIAAHASGWAAAKRASDVLAWRPVVRLARAAAGVTLSTAVLMPVTASAAQSLPPPVMTWEESTRPPVEGAPGPARASPPASDAGPREVVVQPGDHLWALAERRLAEHLGRDPGDATTARYWRTVVEENIRSGRVEHPDLIYPRQVVLLPEIGEQLAK